MSDAETRELLQEIVHEIHNASMQMPSSGKIERLLEKQTELLEDVLTELRRSSPAG
jgi:hypothetical protein